MKICVVLGLLLLAGCGRVAKWVRCERPDLAVVQRYECEKYGYCGPNAGVIRVGETYGFSSDVTTSRAKWVFPDPFPSELLCK